MPHSQGARLGSYEVLGSLGAGGMGEVYRARDIRLGREVAIKVLPEELFTTARLKRFEKEARSASALNHPNIVTVHQIEQFGSTPLIVMELVVGKTLRELLAPGSLSIKKALLIAAQVADGLACAHEAGIVHRDLKPENLMITKDDRVKILDFGLAKLTPGDSENDAATGVPTITKGTEPGVILGTVGYMSPEQASGHPVDYRSDQFSFGSILYEMATGSRAFQRKTSAQTLAAIIQDEPEPIASLNPKAPAPLRWIVERCLAKDRADRYASTRDLARDLGAVRQHVAELTSTSGSSAKVKPPERRKTLWWLTAVVAAAALAAVLLFTLPRLGPGKTAGYPMRFSVSPPEKWVFHSLGYDAGPVTVSPDGRRLGFVAMNAEGRSGLWVRTFDALAAEQLPGTEGASFPFWSSDSRFLAFFADGKLKKIEVSGGTPQTLCAVQDARGGTWNREGVILFSPARDRLIYRVSASGGLPTPATQLNKSRSEVSHRWPYFLPDGRHFVYWARAMNGASEIHLGSLDSTEGKPLIRTSSNAIYSPPGYLLFIRDGDLVAQPFNAKELQTTGEPVVVTKGVRHFSLVARGVFSVSENGVLAYQVGPATASSELLWFDRAGKRLGSIGPPGNYGDPRISPDGKRIAMALADPQTGNPDIWIYDVSRAVTTRFTFGAAWNIIPIWSADAKRVLFSSNRAGPFNLYVKPSSGIGEEQLLLSSNQQKWPSDWSLDGRFIAYNTSNPKGNREIWIYPLFGDRKPFPFERSEFGEFGATFSPDGGWLAYVSEESGGREVYVQSFPARGEKLRISTAGGVDPKWRADGKELFYQALDNQLMAVETEPGARLKASAPSVLFKINPTSINAIYDVSADGQSFLVNTISREEKALPVTVVLNWTATLKEH